MNGVTARKEMGRCISAWSLGKRYKMVGMSLGISTAWRDDVFRQEVLCRDGPHHAGTQQQNPIKGTATQHCTALHSTAQKQPRSKEVKGVFLFKQCPKRQRWLGMCDVDKLREHRATQGCGGLRCCCYRKVRLGQAGLRVAEMPRVREIREKQATVGAMRDGMV